MPAEPLPEWGDPKELGPGIYYIEYDGEWATRQCEIFANGLRLSSLDPAYFMCDQSISRMQFPHPTITEITVAEFEDAWRRADPQSN
jgi:hypothetical protein